MMNSCFLPPVTPTLPPSPLAKRPRHYLHERFTKLNCQSQRHDNTNRGTYMCSKNSKSINRRTMLQLSLYALLPTLTNAEESTITTTTTCDIDPATNEPAITDRVYFDVSISSGKPQRFVIGLYGELMPRVVKNFKSLAENGYATTSVYRIVPGLTIQLGDVLNNKGKSGKAADGIDSFIPDNFRVSHTIPGIVSMVRRPDGSVDSRFFIATRKGDSMYLDGKYAGFGRVVDGMNTVKDIERAGGEGFIKRPVQIVASGVLP